jgi:hypothetical protein
MWCCSAGRTDYCHYTSDSSKVKSRSEVKPAGSPYFNSFLLYARGIYYFQAIFASLVPEPLLLRGSFDINFIKSFVAKTSFRHGA